MNWQGNDNDAIRSLSYKYVGLLNYFPFHVQTSLNTGWKTILFSLDFPSEFDSVHHKALLYKLKSGVLTVRFLKYFISFFFLSDRSQHVSIDCYFSSFFRVTSGVSQGSVLGHFLLFLILVICGVGFLPIWFRLQMMPLFYVMFLILHLNIT